MTFNLSALWVVICSLCALTAVSNGVLVAEPIFYLGLFIFIAGFSIEVIADNQKHNLEQFQRMQISLLQQGFGLLLGIQTISAKLFYGLG